MEKKKKTPEIRFRGFDDAWEQRKLGDVGSTYGGLSGKTKTDFGHGKARFVPYTNVFDNPVTDTKRLEAIEIDPSQNEVKPGDAFFTVSSETPEEVGMASIWLSDQENVYLNSFCFGYRQDGTFSPHYLAYMLRSSSVRADLTLLAQGISRFNISKNKVMELRVPAPSMAEQRKLGNCFYKLDNLITLHQRKCEKLVQLKRAMLGKMFPKDGEKTPEIRFRGFADAWEQRKLGELAHDFGYGLNAAAKPYDGKTKYLRITDIDDDTHKFNQDELTSPDAPGEDMSKYLLNQGDLLFARTGASVGKTYRYQRKDGRAAFAGFLIRAVPNSDCDSAFLYQATLTESYTKYISVTSQRSGQPGVNAAEYAELPLMAPSLVEQCLIGRYLEQLDSFITLHQRKHEKLVQLKRAMLGKMFA